MFEQDMPFNYASSSTSIDALSLFSLYATAPLFELIRYASECTSEDPYRMYSDESKRSSHSKRASSFLKALQEQQHHYDPYYAPHSPRAICSDALDEDDEDDEEYEPEHAYQSAFAVPSMAMARQNLVLVYLIPLLIQHLLFLKQHYHDRIRFKKGFNREQHEFESPNLPILGALQRAVQL